jgi:hypothetical protein
MLICLAAGPFRTHAQEPSQWGNLRWTQDLTFDQVKAVYEAERDAHEAADSTSAPSGVMGEDEGEDEEEDEIAFQRFEYFWRPRVNTDVPNKAGKLQHYVDQLFDQYETSPLCTQNLNPSSWQLLGPFHYSTPGALNHNMGMVSAVWADPAETPLTHVLAGTNSSGLWRGTLGEDGWTWACMTDNLRMPGLGVASIAVNTNGDIYIGTTIGYRGGYAAGVWRLDAQTQTWTNLQDFPPTAPDPGVRDIKFIGDYCYVVQAKHVMRAPRNADLSIAGVFTELVVPNAPSPSSAVNYLEITGFTVPSGDGLMLCSKGDNGVDGGGKIYRSFDAGNTWIDISTFFAPPSALVGGIRPYSVLLGDVGTDPNEWQVTGSGLNASIHIQPTNIPSGGLTKTFCATANSSFLLAPTASYTFRFDCAKNSEVTIRAYLIKGQNSPIDLSPQNSQLIMDVTNNDDLPFETTFQANDYYRRIAIQVYFPETYDPNAEPQGVTLNQLQGLPPSMHFFAAIFTSGIGHSRCSSVNIPNNTNNGIYICALNILVINAYYTVYKSIDGFSFTQLYTSTPLDELSDDFNKNKSVFSVSPNGTMYTGGVLLYGHAPPDYQRIELNTGHVDSRAMLNLPSEGGSESGTLLVGDDGGVALSYEGGSPNATFQDINGNSFPITQFYGMGMDDHERLLVGGTQDNSSWKYYPGIQTWEKYDGGDGGRSRSYSNKSGTRSAIVHMANQSTFLDVTNEDESVLCSPSHTHTQIDLGNPAELFADPNTDEVKCYLGHGDLYRMSCTDDPAVNLTAGLVAFHDNNNSVWAIGIHKNDDHVMFIGGFGQKWNDENNDAPGRLYRTTDGGLTWTDIGSNLATSGHQPLNWFGVNAIAVDPDAPPSGPATVYAAFSGYSNSGDQRVLKSVDGGLNWTDISAGLTNFQVNDLAVQEGSGGILYAATDVGVYVYDPQIGHWSCFNEGLPVCIATEVDVNTCSGKLYASTFGRGVWVTGLYEPNRVAELVVDADDTWGDVREMANTVRVANGATLTITGELRMYPDRGIIVEPGGHLVVDGGTITSTCNGFWPGIQVWGNRAEHQFGIPYPDHQGILVLKNGALIENAREGVQAMNPDDWETTGGVVEATDAVFLNCHKAASFIYYHNFQPPTPGYRVNNFSFFRRCRFEVNDQYPGGNDFEAHVSLWDVDGIVFSQCDFINAQTTGPGHIALSHDLGCGIVAADASFGVFGKCTVVPPDGQPCPDGHTIPGTFTGLDHGVHVLNGGGGVHPFTVDHCDFSNNICGVYANGVIGCKVTKCNFTLGDRDVTLNGEVDEMFNLMHRGIFLTESYDLRVDENTLAQANGGAAQTEGIVVGYSRDNNEMVFKNNATGLTYAYVGEGICVDVNNKPAVGLTFKCNENTDNEYDFWNRMVTPGSDPITFPDQTIRTIQGAMDRPADNSFDRSEAPPAFSDFNTNSVFNVVTYLFMGEGTPYQPVDVRAPYITPYPASTRLGGNCQSRLLRRVPPLGPVGLAELGGELQTEKLAYGNTRYLYDQLIDGGSTDQTVQEIQASWPEEAWELRAMLLEKSPYLSTEVLMEMDKKGILPDAMVAEICIANPEATSKDGFTDWLEFKAPHPLPAYLIDQIIASWDSKTYRFTLERDMARHHQDMTQAAILWLDHFQGDTAYAPVDSLRMVWRQVRTSAARYAEALTWLQQQRFDSAAAAVEEIPADDPKLKERQVAEKDRMLALIGFFRDMDAQGKNAAQLDHNDIGRLEDIIDHQYDRPATWAQNLLCFHYGHCRPPLTGGEGGAAPRMVHAPTAGQAAKALPALLVRPNPANTWVVFEYRIVEPVKDAYIRITGVDGRELTRIRITSPEDQPVYDTRQVAKGAYTVELVNAGKTVETGKLVVE